MLEVRDLHLSFSGVRALAGIDLAVAKGETVGIIGPNGSGKSTLFNVVSGIYAPQRGSVHLRGVSVAGKSPGALVALGLARTYQNKRLFGSMSVFENALVPAMRKARGSALGDMFGRREGRAAAARRARACLAFVGLDGLASARAASLAYGQQNRLELARALALEPALLLLDEPAAGLSGTEREEMSLLIGRIHALGVTVALVEHDMAVVTRLCSRVVVLDEGKVIASGSPAAVARDPAVIAADFGAVDA